MVTEILFVIQWFKTCLFLLQLVVELHLAYPVRGPLAAQTFSEFGQVRNRRIENRVPVEGSIRIVLRARISEYIIVQGLGHVDACVHVLCDDIVVLFVLLLGLVMMLLDVHAILRLGLGDMVPRLSATVCHLTVLLRMVDHKNDLFCLYLDEFRVRLSSTFQYRHFDSKLIILLIPMYN